MNDLELVQKRIDFYEKQLVILYDNKPYWFQKKALKRYYEKIDFFEERIMNVYSNFEKEIELDLEILNSLENKR